MEKIEIIENRIPKQWIDGKVVISASEWEEILELMNYAKILKKNKKEGIEITEKLDKFLATVPEKYVMPNTKISNTITKDTEELIGKNMKIYTGSREKPIIVGLMLNVDEDKVKLYKEFTCYDRAVYNAICSLYNAGNKGVTPAMVYRTMNGVTENEYVSKTACKSIEATMDKLMHMFCEIDFREEARRRGYKNPDRAIMQGYLFGAVKKELKLNGIFKNNQCMY